MIECIEVEQTDQRVIDGRCRAPRSAGSAVLSSEERAGRAIRGNIGHKGPARKRFRARPTGKAKIAKGIFVCQLDEALQVRRGQTMNAVQSISARLLYRVTQLRLDRFATSRA
jgi:hypothetical protein